MCRSYLASVFLFGLIKSHYLLSSGKGHFFATHMRARTATILSSSQSTQPCFFSSSRVLCTFWSSSSRVHNADWQPWTSSSVTFGKKNAAMPEFCCWTILCSANHPKLFSTFWIIIRVLIIKKMKTWSPGLISPWLHYRIDLDRINSVM